VDVQCGPTNDVGSCTFGVSACNQGQPGPCEGAVLPGVRLCNSSADNDCNGVADNAPDATCECTLGATRACGTVSTSCSLMQRVQRCNVATDGSSSHWSECAFDGRVGSVCQAQTLAAGSQRKAMSLVSPYLYFVGLDASGRTSAVERLPISGGPAQNIAPVGLSPQLTLIVANGSDIFGAEVGQNAFGTAGTGSALGRMSLLGDAFALLPGSTVSTFVGALRTNATHLFFASTGSRSYIERIPRGGGERTLAVSSAIISYTEFEVDDAFVYALSSGDVSRIPVAGGDVTPVATWTNAETVTDIGVTDTTLALASSTRLATVPKSGGPLTTRDPANAYRLTTTPEAIYYFRASAGGGATCSNGSELMRLPINGSAVTLIAREPAPCVREMSADAAAVYWIAGDGGSVRKVGD